MRRVIWSVMVSLDGRSAAAGEGFETIDWFRADDEWLGYSVELLDGASTLLFGGPPSPAWSSTGRPPRARWPSG